MTNMPMSTNSPVVVFDSSKCDTCGRPFRCGDDICITEAGAPIHLKCPPDHKARAGWPYESDPVSPQYDPTLYGAVDYICDWAGYEAALGGGDWLAAREAVRRLREEHGVTMTFSKVGPSEPPEPIEVTPEFCLAVEKMMEEFIAECEEHCFRRAASQD